MAGVNLTLMWGPNGDDYSDGVTISHITWKLIRSLIARDALGKKKYGVSLDRDDLTHDEWLEHFTEEMLDAAGYAQAAKQRMIEEKNAKRTNT